MRTELKKILEKSGKFSVRRSGNHVNINILTQLYIYDLEAGVYEEQMSMNEKINLLVSGNGYIFKPVNG